MVLLQRLDRTHWTRPQPQLPPGSKAPVQVGIEQLWAVPLTVPGAPRDTTIDVAVTRAKYHDADGDGWFEPRLASKQLVEEVRLAGIKVGKE